MIDLTIRLTPEQHEKLRRLSFEGQMSIVEIVRQLVDGLTGTVKLGDIRERGKLNAQN